MNIYYLFHFFHIESPNAEKRLAQVRKVLEKNNIRIVADAGTHPNLTTVSTEKTPQEVVISIIGLFGSVNVLVAIPRTAADKFSYTHPSSLRKKLAIPEQVDPQSFVREVLAVLESDSGFYL